MVKTVQRIHSHIKAVRSAIRLVTDELQQRADSHDDSKFQSDEWEYYSAYERLPEGLEFGSQAYKDALKALGIGVGTPGFSMHSDRNDHHPEHYDAPTLMGVFPIIEMVCDWCGAHIAYRNKCSWRDSVKYNVSRFDFSDRQVWLISEVADFLWKNHHELRNEEG